MPLVHKRYLLFLFSKSSCLRSVIFLMCREEGVINNNFKRHMFCTSSANIFYQPLPSLPGNGERWRRRKRHWNNKWKGCHQACSPRLPIHLQPRQVERCRGELTPPHKPLPLLDSLRLQRQISRIASNLEVVSMIADIGQQQWSCTLFRLSDRTLVSRVRDYCDLTGISGIPGGSQTFGCRMDLGHFLAWRTGTNSLYSPPIKAGRQELPPH